MDRILTAFSASLGTGLDDTLLPQTQLFVVLLRIIPNLANFSSSENIYLSDTQSRFPKIHSWNLLEFLSALSTVWSMTNPYMLHHPAAPAWNDTQCLPTLLGSRVDWVQAVRTETESKRTAEGLSCETCISG